MKKLYFGDCLDVLKELHKEHPQGFIDLIYIDPPFNSKRDYNILFEDIDIKDTKAQKMAFADTWSNVSYLDTLVEIKELDLDLYRLLRTLDEINISQSSVSYLTTMSIRIYYMHKVLKDTGSFYLHCDPSMSHYLKIVCDLIFSQSNFLNEIVWCYRGGGSSKTSFGKRHDIILRYSKSKEFCFNDEEIRIPYTAEGLSRTDDAMWGRHAGSDKVYKPHPLGKVPEDWWPINILNANDPERLGYPTQKPEALLERIIKSSSNEGDIIADFFCGCGTSIATAENLKRNWVGVDISHLAIKLIIDRLTNSTPQKRAKKLKEEIEIKGFPRDVASAHELSENTKDGRFGFQEWIVEVMLGGVLNPKRTADGGWDGYITFDKPDDKEKGVVLIEVKSGKVNVKNVREFIQVVGKRESEIGVFVCFKGQVTQPMLKEAKQQGYFDEQNFGNRIDKIQIITVEDLLDGKEINLPIGLYKKTTFKQASKKDSKLNDQVDIFD